MVTTTPTPVFEGPLRTTDAASINALRDVLDRHGFARGAVIDAIGRALPFGKAHQRDDLPLYLKRLEAPTPINTLAKLFALNRSVDESRAAAAVAPIELDTLRELGLLEDGPRGIRATVRLSVYQGLILAHDALDEERTALRPDHVLDVNPTTMALSNLTVRRQVARALEIGTGCGVLALLAARHAGHVVATDTNPRALNLATFNAAINGVTNVEFRQGSLFDAVAGERFDLIFSNPPYVISPDSQFIYRDGGRRGDALCEEIVRRTPEFLNDGGFASFLINWAIPAGEAWAAPLRRWVEGNGCDSWLMLSSTQDPMTYAAVWNRGRDRDVYAAGLDRWLRYFEELQVQALGLGAVVLRRRLPGATWIRTDHLEDNITSPAGAHIERLFAAEDCLAAAPDAAAVLGLHLKAAPDHRLHQVLQVDAGLYAIEAAEVRLQGGLPFRGNVDGYAVRLMARADGRRALGDIAAEMAGEAGIDPAQFLPACAAIARRMIANGFLIS